MPDGVVNIVHGYGETAGAALVRNPHVPVITFTGSRETGVAVTKAAADHLKHVHLELGGKNAIIVLDDADLDLAVEGIVWSAFGTSGQRCTAASRVIAHEKVYDALQSRLVERAEKMRLGPGWEDETDIGPVINRAAIDKIHSYTKIGQDEGARLLTGGEIATEGDLGKGFFYRPTIFGDVDAQMRIAQEEIFGPTTALIKVRDFDEALRVANGIKYGLSSSIFTRDVNRAFRAMRDLQTGITYVNAGTTGAEVHLPFGGTKDTGQRPPRGGPGRARRLHRVEVDLRRLLGPAAAGPDRQHHLEAVEPPVRGTPTGRARSRRRGLEGGVPLTQIAARSPRGAAQSRFCRCSPRSRWRRLRSAPATPAWRRARRRSAPRRPTGSTAASSSRARAASSRPQPGSRSGGRSSGARRAAAASTRTCSRRSSSSRAPDAPIAVNGSAAGLTQIAAASRSAGCICT